MRTVPHRVHIVLDSADLDFLVANRLGGHKRLECGIGTNQHEFAACVSNLIAKPAVQRDSWSRRERSRPVAPHGFLRSRARRSASGHVRNLRAGQCGAVRSARVQASVPRSRRPARMPPLPTPTMNIILRRSDHGCAALAIRGSSSRSMGSTFMGRPLRAALDVWIPREETAACAIPSEPQRLRLSSYRPLNSVTTLRFRNNAKKICARSCG